MQRNITIILAGVSLLFCCQSQSSKEIPGRQEANEVITSDSIIKDTASGWKEIKFTENQIQERLAYADTTNFMHEKIYPCPKCFLRPEVADALLKANQFARAKNLRLIIFDCYRPKIYQQKMFDIVKDPRYVADPSKGSMHNRGMAVDLGLTDDKGRQLDFGTEFDNFTEKAHYGYSDISDTAKRNRKVLQEIMMKAGFEPYEYEWWHFNYTKTQYPLDDFVWNCN